MSIYDHTRPINDGDIKKAKTFYDIVCWGGLLIVLLPVGIANIILGYMMGDSPCTLCWVSANKWPISVSSRSLWCAMASSPNTSPRCS